MTKHLNLLQVLLDHPRVGLVIALILGGLALSGKFSVTATRIMFFLGWAVAVFSFYGFPPLRSRPPLFWLCSISFGLALIWLGAWARPEAVPLNWGVLIARRPILLWSAKEPKSAMQIGDSGVYFIWDGPQGQAMIKFFRDSELTIERSGKKVLVSTKVRNQNGDLVAELIRNQWKTTPTAWDRNYTDDALEVKDSRGKIVLQVKALPDRIQLQGEWWDASTNGVRIVKCTHPDGRPGACFILMTPTYRSDDDPEIEPMFEYPSELNFGVLARPRG